MTSRILLALTLIAGPLAAQQPPPVGIIDFYGLRKVSREAVQRALGLVPGDSLPDQADPVIGRLKAIPGVQDATLNPVCCEHGLTILYVGIVETGAPVPQWNPVPKGSERLPEQIRALGAAFDSTLGDAVGSGDMLEEDSAGHALMHYPPARTVQLRFPAIADSQLELLRTVLRRSADSEDRARAAQIIAYTSDKASVVPDLLSAARDPEPAVRNAAIRALAVMAAARQPVKVRPDAFISLMQSPVWTDRNKASLALMQLSQNRDPDLMTALQSVRAELVEMARWQSFGHSAAALVILGRMGGMTEQALGEAFKREDREAIIRSVQ